MSSHASTSPDTNTFKFKCPQCPQYCTDELNIVKHFNENHPNVYKSIYKTLMKCQHCPCLFSDKSGFLNHLKQTHPQVPISSSGPTCIKCPANSSGENAVNMLTKHQHTKTLHWLPLPKQSGTIGT